MSRGLTAYLSQRFCFREPFCKLLPILSSVTFRIFWGHRCILNLPYVLRIGVVHFRSPSHQPSTSHHCVLCRWLGESRPALKLSIVSWSTILIEQSLIEVKVAVSLIFCLDHLCGPQRDMLLSKSLCVLVGLTTRATLRTSRNAFRLFFDFISNPSSEVTL